MRTGLVLEGGAMRGLFTAGVTDVLMENGVTFDGAIGVSAGAAFGCNYKSGQSGRAVRYNKRFCNNWRYVSFRSLLLTGDIYGADFCYRRIPDELDPFDRAAFAASPMAFYALCTDMQTGTALVQECRSGDARDLTYIRASASMPLVSRPVQVDGYTLSDGGTANSIPLQWMEEAGYDRNVVVLTQPRGFQKTPNSFMPLLRRRLRRYPLLVAALETRHIRYNQELQYVRAAEQAGRALAVYPPAALEIGSVEHNPRELERVYQIGRRTAMAQLDQIVSFLKV